MRALVVLIAVTLGLTSCVAIESNRAGSAFRNQFGEPKKTQLVGTYSLPRRYLSFEVFGNASTMRGASRFKVDRKAEIEFLGPDPNPGFRYEVNYTPSRFSKDEIDITIDNQILQTVTVATEDQTAQALTNLARSLGNLSRLGRGLGDTPGAAAEGEPTELIATLKLDPTDPVSVARTKHVLSHDHSHGLELQVSPPPRPVQVIPACNHAICYRPLTTVTLTFIDRRSGNVTEYVTSVPDPHQLSGLDIERSAFVRRDTILTFTDGTLKSVDITKPSELAAAALLPLEVVNAIFAGTNEAIASLLGLRRNELSASAELLRAQAEFLKALQAYRAVEADVLGPGSGVDTGSDEINTDTTGGRIDPDDADTIDTASDDAI